MLRVAVVDDDAQDRAKISAGLDFVAAQKDVSFSISEFDSGDQFLVKYEPNYDIVFMDVEFLSGANGIEAAHQLRKIDKTVVLVFVTRMAQMAVKGYEVDALDFIPKHEAGRDSLLAILNNVAVQVKKLQEPKTGGWYQVMDRSGDKGNYLESSCSAMFIYSLFKAVRMGYIDQSYLDVALKGYEGFLKNFIEVDKEGVVTITKACAVAGLGGKVYRSGDYDYYINETIRNNDPKAVGPFIMASLEYERLQK